MQEPTCQWEIEALEKKSSQSEDLILGPLGQELITLLLRHFALAFRV